MTNISKIIEILSKIKSDYGEIPIKIDKFEEDLNNFKVSIGFSFLIQPENALNLEDKGII